MRKDVYHPYAIWLAENERFVEAQQGSSVKSINIVSGHEQYRFNSNWTWTFIFFFSLLLFYYLAFYEAGETNESYNVLNQLLLNSINENRFNDGAYYSWLLANYFSHLAGHNSVNGDKIDSTLISADDDNDDDESGEDNGDKAERLYKQADIYYAYYPVYKYIVSSFQ